ncbi:MAG: RNA polymerase sigma factor [Acidobacteriota bacterium]
MDTRAVDASDPEREARDALARGDREGALAALMRIYGSPLYRFCRQMVADGDLALDVQQTTFLQAFEGLAGFGGRSSFRAWLYGIARHRCLDAIKSARRREKRFALAGELPEKPAPGKEADVSLGERARTEALRRCLADLPPHVRDAVLLRFQEGFSYEQMSRMLHERAPTLQARVARALPVLRRCLEGGGFAA